MLDYAKGFLKEVKEEFKRLVAREREVGRYNRDYLSKTDLEHIKAKLDLEYLGTKFSDYHGTEPFEADLQMKYLTFGDWRSILRNKKERILTDALGDLSPSDFK